LSDLLAELAGNDFAQRYSDVIVSGCKIKKEDMSMSVDIDSYAFPCVLPFSQLRSAIRERFGVDRIRFNVKYLDFALTDKNKQDFYSNVRDYICYKKSTLTKFFTGSTADFDNNKMSIALRFDDNGILVREGIGNVIKEYIKRSFNLNFDIEFTAKTDTEEKLLAEIEAERQSIASHIEVNVEVEEKPKRKPAHHPLLHLVQR